MRITGGQLKGRSVQCPDGLNVRPTASKVRQAFFNILSSRIEQAAFLDLSAGSGLLGFEAVSRGARLVTFVEENKRQVASIRKSIETFAEALGESAAEVVSGDVRRILPTLRGSAYDIIFADPPYKHKCGPMVLEGAMANDLLAADGLIVIEHFRDDPLEAGLSAAKLDLEFERIDYREYGQTALSFFARS